MRGVNPIRKKAASRVTEFMNGPFAKTKAFFSNPKTNGQKVRNKMKKQLPKAANAIFGFSCSFQSFNTTDANLNRAVQKFVDFTLITTLVTFKELEGRISFLQGRFGFL